MSSVFVLREIGDPFNPPPLKVFRKNPTKGRLEEAAGVNLHQSEDTPGYYHSDRKDFYLEEVVLNE